MLTLTSTAPRAPGIGPFWPSSSKSGVGTAISGNSRVWFTLSHGILNEVYYPRVDQACVRDMGLIVTDRADFFSEEKRAADSAVHWLTDGVPAFRLVNTCREGRYRIEKEVITDPHRDTLLQRVRFTPQQGALSGFDLHVLLAPHPGDRGQGNTAWVEDFESAPLLFAQRNGHVMALACSAPWTKRSVGYVGSSDGWQDLKAHQRMTWEFTRAENGHVALTAGIDLLRSQGDFVLALGFGKTPDEAARNAIASLSDGFAKAKNDYIAGWQDWMNTHAASRNSEPGAGDLSRISLAVLRAHGAKTSPGGLIASLASPWGRGNGDNDLGGYHLVWSRDMVETAGGLLAAGAHEDVRGALSFLRATQRSDGHWPRNMLLDGSANRTGIRMDETALPILLVDLAHREGALVEGALVALWPMVRTAAGYLARNGPVSADEQWEEAPDYSPFTVAVEIAALLVAADFADLNHEAALASYLRELADVWNSSIERWMYVSDTDWCRQFNVQGYYVRIAPTGTGGGPSSFQDNVHVRNFASAEESHAARRQVSSDALALVRFGLRDADDARIRDTEKVIDGLLKVETPSGPTWRRSNDDGYGEHENGAPFDGTGIGRGWPLLTGERAHHELAAGRIENANRLLAVLESFASSTGLLSEQVWDAPDIPERELQFGRPSGSAMPLARAHAEYLKLRRSLRDGRVFDRPPQTVRRYLTGINASPRMAWRVNHKLRSIIPGKTLRIELLAPALIHWTADDWQEAQDVMTRDVGLGMHIADLPTEALRAGKRIKFTFYWPDADDWEDRDFMVYVGS